MTGEPVTPFKGLAAFTDSELDARLFFGRERDIQTIAANLIASRFTVLYGASGVGKSSALSAGVVRRTRELAPEALVVAHRDWTGGELLGALSASIPGLQPASGRSLADALAELAESRGSEVYLALDQFEEVFLHRGSAAFVRALAEVVTRPGLRAHVLVSVREDALSELDVFTGLIPNVFGNYLPLDRLDRESARLAITGPVARMAELTPGAAVEVEPGLVEAVLDQTGVGRVALGGVALGGVAAADPDRIEAPYLQLVMQRLWEAEREQGSNVLRRSTLEELGGARGILRAHLERALGALEPDERDAAARMFHHLVTPSGTKIAHRVADLAEYADVPEDVVRNVLAKLAPRRIVRPLDGSVELYHDVLADAVLAWRTQHDAERRLEQQRAASHARQRRLAIAVAVCLVALAAMTALTVYALSQRSDARANARKARGNAREAQSKRLDAIASALIPVAPPNIDPELGLLLATRAARVAADPPADDILRRALLQSFLRRVLPERGVASAKFSPDGRSFAVGTRKGTVHVYRGNSHKPLLSVRAASPLTSVVLSHDGERLLTVAERGPMIVWDVATGRRLAVLQAGATFASFSPDAQLVLSADRHQVRVWRISDRSVQARWRPPGLVRVASFAPGGGDLVIAAGRTVSTFRSTGGPPLVAVDHRSAATSALVTPDGRTLVTGGLDGVVRVWELGSGRLVDAITGHHLGITALALTPDGTTLVSTSTDGSGRIVDLRRGSLVASLNGHTNHVTGVEINQSGSHVLTWSKDDTARVWGIARGATTAVLTAGKDSVRSASFGLLGLVLTTGADGRARLWQAPVSPRLHLLRRMTARAHAAAIAPGGQTIAVATPSALTLFDGQARPLNRYPVDSIRAVAVGSGRVAYLVGRRVVVRRVAGGHIDASFRVPGAPEALAFSPNGGALAVGTAPGAVSIRRLDTGKTTRLSSSTGAVTSLAFSTAGALLAAGDAGGYVTIWRASGGVPLRKWLAHRRGTRILGVVFNRSNRLLATTGRDAEVRVWRVGDGRPVADLSGHFSTVNGVEFSPDGRWIVSAGPGKAGLWDVAGQRKLLFLEGHQGKLLAAAFDESGRRIETVGVDGTIRAYACGVCGRVPELLRLADARLAATGTRLTNHEAKALGIG